MLYQKLQYYRANKNDMKPPDKKFIFGAIILAVIFAMMILFGGCKKEKVDPCKTCVTTLETYYLSYIQDTQVKSSIKYCNGEADTIKQGTVKTKFYIKGKAEFTKVVCD